MIKFVYEFIYKINLIFNHVYFLIYLKNQSFQVISNTSFYFIYYKKYYNIYRP